VALNLNDTIFFPLIFSWMYAILTVLSTAKRENVDWLCRPKRNLESKMGQKLEKHRISYRNAVFCGGDKRDRTADLLNAIGKIRKSNVSNAYIYP